MTRRQTTAGKTSELKKHTVFIWAHVASLVSDARAVGDLLAAESLLDEVSATPCRWACMSARHCIAMKPPTTAATAYQVTVSLYDILRSELLAGGTAHSLPVSSSRLQAAIDSILAEGIPSGVAEEAEVAMAITESRRLCSRNKALYTYVETMIKTTVI